jgi:hypothetical protein
LIEMTKRTKYTPHRSAGRAVSGVAGKDANELTPRERHAIKKMLISDSISLLKKIDGPHNDSDFVKARNVARDDRYGVVQLRALGSTDRLIRLQAWDNLLLREPVIRRMLRKIPATDLGMQERAAEAARFLRVRMEKEGGQPGHGATAHAVPGHVAAAKEPAARKLAMAITVPKQAPMPNALALCPAA